MDPGHWHANLGHVAARVFQEYEVVLQSVVPGVIHIGQDTNKFVPAKPQTACQSSAVIDPTRHRAKAGLQIDHPNHAYPSSE
jgi:hypothetical protein